jgi:hypothetical protein
MNFGNREDVVSTRNAAAVGFFEFNALSATSMGAENRIEQSAAFDADFEAARRSGGAPNGFGRIRFPSFYELAATLDCGGHAATGGG